MATPLEEVKVMVGRWVVPTSEWMQLETGLWVVVGVDMSGMSSGRILKWVMTWSNGLMVVMMDG